MNVPAIAPPPLPSVDVPAPAPRPGDNYVQSFARGLTLLRSFGAEAPAQTLSGAAARCGMTRAGSRRILLTLHELGYVAADGRHFRLAPKALELGLGYLRSQADWRLARASLESLAQAVREACADAVIEGKEIVFTLRVPAVVTANAALSGGALQGLLAAAASIEALVQSHE